MALRLRAGANLLYRLRLIVRLLRVVASVHARQGSSMDMPRLSKSVRRITILNRDGSGGWSPIVLFRKGRKRKKKPTALVRPVERLTRSLVEASDKATSTYLRRHKKANRKRRDGWVRDLPKNIVRAANKGAREIRPADLLGL